MPQRRFTLAAVTALAALTALCLPLAATAHMYLDA